jgi:hypothetical protein
MTPQHRPWEVDLILTVICTINGRKIMAPRVALAVIAILAGLHLAASARLRTRQESLTGLRVL